MDYSFRQFLLQKQGRLALAGLLAFGLGLAPGQIAAQVTPLVLPAGTTASTPVYLGPRFRGGPDSVRALVARALRPAGPALAGQVFLQLELNEVGAVRTGYLLTPPRKTPAADLAKHAEVRALAQQLAKRLTPWQLVPSTGPDQGANALNTIALPLLFGPGAETAPLSYSDEMPTFRLADGRPDGAAVVSLPRLLQRQVAFPAEDIRNRVSGTVYAYLEVSETGAVTQRSIVGSLSPGLDAEVLRVLGQVPNASTPPRQAGRPVRVGYVLPFRFKTI
ncbi:MAG: energy transducer TonB [Janthinobacterium lividum]